jgi:hydrogenase expression/formation protein HypC
MCLAIPGKLIELVTDPSGIQMGRVNFGGITKKICLEYTPEAKVGDYLLVHVGFALSTVDEEEARRTYALLREISGLDELDISEPAETPPARSSGEASPPPVFHDSPRLNATT